MNIIEINKKFNTKKKCIDYLVKLRWEKSVFCPKCNSTHVLKNKKLIETTGEKISLEFCVIENLVQKRPLV